MPRRVDWAQRFEALLQELHHELATAQEARTNGRWDVASEHYEAATAVCKRMSSVAEKVHQTHE